MAYYGLVLAIIECLCLGLYIVVCTCFLSLGFVVFTLVCCCGFVSILGCVLILILLWDLMRCVLWVSCGFCMAMLGYAWFVLFVFGGCLLACLLGVLAGWWDLFD